MPKTVVSEFNCVVVILYANQISKCRYVADSVVNRVTVTYITIVVYDISLRA